MDAGELLKRYEAGERNFTGVDLSGAKLTNANLRGANLSEARLADADLRKAYLCEANLNGANLCDALLNNANLNRVKLTKAFLCYAKLINVNLSYANLSAADLTKADLCRANLIGSNQQRANLIYANLSKANLSKANLGEAYLSQANLNGANLISANLTKADLIGANLFEADLTNANLSEAKLDGTILTYKKTSEELQQQNQELIERVKLLEVQLTQQKPVQNLIEVTNQGVNAPYQWNGFHFRSKAEIKVAEALDRTGILFYPNSKARLNKDKVRINRESDFLVFQAGKFGILEVDGRKYHQTAADDHERDRLFKRYGIRVIERFDATRCWNEPDKVVQEFLEILNQA